MPRPDIKAPLMDSLKRSPVSENLSPDCRCQCSVVCMINGPSSIKPGETKTYRLKITVAKNDGCEDESQGDTKWGVTLSNPQAKDKVHLQKKEKNSVETKVDKGCPATDLILQADPTVTYKCKGALAGAARITCQAQGNTARVKVEP